jgi:large subunit ribosomal protein L10
MNESILEEKKAIVARFSKALSTSKCVLVVTYHNLDVAAINVLRKDLKKNGGKMEVAKNTLTRRALDDENFKPLDPLLKGPNALIVSNEETKIIVPLLTFVSAHKEMELKGGIIGGVYCDPDKIKALAFVPDKNAALSTLVSVLQSPVTKFACTLKAYADKQQGSAAKA